MFAAAESDLEPCRIKRPVEQPGEIGRRGAADIERQPRQQLLDQVELMGAKLVALAASEERARPPIAGLGQGLAIVGLERSAAHRSVWYSRCNSRARGSIEEM